MGTAIEIDIIADLGANADGSGKCLESSTWIYREIGLSVGQADKC
jgi:hypothetical protein